MNAKRTVATVQFHSLFASSPLLFSLWLFPVFISPSVNYAPIFLHSLSEDYLGSYLREEIDSIYNNFFKFLPLNKHTYLCNLWTGVGVEDKESPLIFPRPVLPLIPISSEPFLHPVSSLYCVFHLLLVTDSMLSAHKYDTVSPRVVLIYSP